MFIHELVHAIEKRNSPNIINEVVTQKAAINITRRLHDNGIFLFDNPIDYQIEGTTKYEALFPIIEPILTNYFYILKDAHINGSFNLLD